MPLSKTHYGQLLLMVILSFISMYVLMYAMVDSFANAYMNLNQFYMAGLMTAPMVILELAVMGAMYPNKKMNTVIIAAGLLALIVFWILIREQTAITDKQFLRSMIPHHAGAVLMCGKAPISDPRIQELCRAIIPDQQEEIAQMKAILNDYGK